MQKEKDDGMIAITKTEKEIINKRFPKVHIVRTMKKKSKRHHYYCEEAKSVMRFLKKYRSGKTEEKKNRCADNRFKNSKKPKHKNIHNKERRRNFYAA